jgi:hypothetical protein
MPIEFLYGRPRKLKELRVIGVALEQLDSIDANDPWMRAALFAEHALAMVFAHLVGDAASRQLTSLANGACGRQFRHDSAGIRPVTIVS